METSYIRMMSNFPILVETRLIFPILWAPAPFPKRGVRALPWAKTVYMHVKCGRNVLKTQRYDSTLSTHFSFQPLLNYCVLRAESVKCPARAVIAKSRARHVHVMSLNLLTSRKSPLI